MAALPQPPPPPPPPPQPPSSSLDPDTTTTTDHQDTHHSDLLATYLGISFTLFLTLLPSSSLSLIPTLQSRNRYLLLRLNHLSDQLSDLKSRRHEDSKANARVVEIFASHRNSWHQEQRRLHHQIEESRDEIEDLRARVDELEERERELVGEVDELRKEREEREEMVRELMATAKTAMMTEKFSGGVGEAGEIRVDELEEEEGEGVVGLGFGQNDAFDSEFGLSDSSRFWAERANYNDNCNLWQQDVQYEPLETMYQMKHFVARRESPWKVEGELTGVSAKLKFLEQELVNLERIGKNDLMKIPSLMRKQAKRYQGLAGKIDDLCKRMQASDPSALSSEQRTQSQPEFLLEAFRLQQRATEMGQKLLALQTEITGTYLCDEGVHAKLTTRRSLDSIRNNFKEIQRNLEIWLARIIGDLKGIMARDGASRVKEYYVSRYSYV